MTLTTTFHDRSTSQHADWQTFGPLMAHPAHLCRVPAMEVIQEDAHRVGLAAPGWGLSACSMLDQVKAAHAVWCLHS